MESAARHYDLPVRRPARAEVVGSLLRPPALRHAVEAFYTNHTAVSEAERAKRRDELTAVEDEAIRTAVKQQIDIGLDVVSDGEFRRWMFLNSFYDAVSGVATDRNTVEFTNARGERVPLSVHSIVDRLEKIDSPASREAAFLSELTNRPFKVAFPAASIFAHPFGVETDAYEDADEFVSHVVEIERELIADAIAAGCRYVQLDFPLYPYLVDEAWASRFESARHDGGALLGRSIAADAAVLEGIPADVTTALHVCRGNHRSSWMCEGSLEPVAERMFGELPYDVFLVEWDDVRREGDYSPIRYTREGATMVMGLVSTKTAAMEDEDDLVRRLDKAAGFLPIEQLALSPQCGFASTLPGNEIDEETQWRKLGLVARVADRVWGS